MGVNHSLCYFDNHYSTGELFPPIPMFRLKIYPRTERKLNCLPPRGQVFKVFVEFRIGTFVTFSVSNDPSQFFLDRIVIKFFNYLSILIHFSTGESNIIYKKLRTVIGRLLSLKMLKVIAGIFPLTYALSTPFTKSFSEHQWKFKKKKELSPAVEPLHFSSTIKMSVLVFRVHWRREITIKYYRHF